MSKDSFDELLREEQRMTAEREAQSSENKTAGKSDFTVLMIILALMLLLMGFGRAKNNIGFGICMFLLGVFILLQDIYNRIVMLKRCTERVTAVCIYLDKKISRSKGHNVTTYAPKWEYTYNGRVYQHQERDHSNVGVPTLDNEYEIFVNPNDPEEIYRKDLKGSLFQCLVGAGLAICGVLVILL